MASLSPEHEDKPAQYEWSKFKEAGLLTEQDTNLLANIKIAKETPEIVKAITERPQEYITLFMKILYNTTQDEPIKFILYMVELACSESEKFVKDLYEVQRLHQLGITTVHFEPMKAYMRLLHKSDIYILEKTFKTLSRFFNMDFKAQVAPTNFNAEETRATIHVQSENSDLENYVDVITRILHQAVKEAEENSQHGNTEHSIKLGKMGVNALASLMKRDECREMFYKSDGIPTLIQLLRCFRDNVQMLYEVCFCIWCLSFNKKIASFFPQNSIIPRLHDVLIRVIKEKVLRVVILTFKNLLSFSSFVDEMIRFGVPKTLQNLLKRKFQDPDIQDQIKSLSDLLEQHIEEISSFDEYRQEVLSGNLKWSPVHTSEKFWKENMAKIEQNNFFILRELVKFLDSKAAQVNDEAELHSMQQPTKAQSMSPGGFGEQQQQEIVGSIDEFRNLAIVCHDIGQFVRYHQRGKKIVTDLGAKTKVLVLMEHPHPEVKKQALLCVQKIMVQQWEFL